MNNFAFIWLISTIRGQFQLQKTVTLTTRNINENGASVQILDTSDTIINGSEWIIIESSSSSGPMDILVNLDNSFGFDSSRASQLEIIINGNTPIGVGNADMMVSFSVDQVNIFQHFKNG